MDIDRSDCMYTSCYCEENIWKLCEEIARTAAAELQHCVVVFISNRWRCVSVWQQASAVTPSHPVLWDYHVVLVYGPPGRPALLYDLDTRLPFPCALATYLAAALRPGQRAADPRANRPKQVRLVPAGLFLAVFASDRSHMLSPATGHYLAPPPPYPPIRTSRCSHNIDEFIDMATAGCGLVVALEELALAAEDSATLRQLLLRCGAAGAVPESDVGAKASQMGR